LQPGHAHAAVVHRAFSHIIHQLSCPDPSRLVEYPSPLRPGILPTNPPARRQCARPC